MSHAHRAVRRYFVGRLGRWGEQRMRRHLDRCAACRRAYRQHLIAERALAPMIVDGAPAWDRMSPRARERGLDRLLDTLEPARRRWRMPVLFAVLTAVAAAAIVWWLRPPPAPPLALGELQIRGIERPRPAGGLDLRMICVDGQRRVAVELADGDPCADVLFLAYTRLPPSRDHLYVLGVDGAGRLHAYYPRPGETRSVAAAARAVDRILGRGVVVARRHDEPGPVWLVALFSDAPLGIEQVRGAAATGPAHDPATWRSLGGDVLIRRFEVPERGRE